MKYLYLAIAGAVSGILGGMGMGGGTLLIPILTLLFDFKQAFSQTINLVAFLPMAVVALIIHCKNNMVKKEGILGIILPALLLSISGSLLAKCVSGNLQTKLFGGFLILLAVFQCVTASKVETKNDDQSPKNVKK